MPRYAALLRGVSPMNARMPALKRCFEAAGFTTVKTLLSSGNVVFDTRPAAIATLQRRAEAAMEKELGKSFLTLVRPVEYLAGMLAKDPFRAFRLPAGAKRMVTFLREPPQAKLALPLEVNGSRILALEESEIFAAYVPGPKGGSAFLARLEKAFGKEMTTRSWDTVRKCAAA